METGKDKDTVNRSFNSFDTNNNTESDNRNNYQENRSDRGGNSYQGERSDRTGNRYQGGFDGQGFAKRPFKQKTNDRQKTDTQEFFEVSGEKIPTFFPVPVGATLPKFQRSIGMAEGVIVEANNKGNGFVEIEGFKYPLKENRSPQIQKRYPLEKYVGKTIKFSFYPTITLKGIKMLRLSSDSPPFVKIANFRREIQKPNYIEILGTVKFVNPNNFVIAIWSASSKKEYVVTVFGKCTAKQGEFVKVDASLKEGKIKLDEIKVFTSIEPYQKKFY